MNIEISKMKSVTFDYDEAMSSLVYEYLKSLIQNDYAVTIQIEELPHKCLDQDDNLLQLMKRNEQCVITSEINEYINLNIDITSIDDLQDYYHPLIHQDVTSITFDCYPKVHHRSSPRIIIWLGIYENAYTFSCEKDDFNQYMQHFLHTLQSE